MNKESFLRYKATYSLLIVTSLVFLYMFFTYGYDGMTSNIALVNSGAMFGPDIIANPTHIWRFVTPIFVHIGLAHFGMNMFFLFAIGREIESLYGSFKFFILYMMSGIFANTMLFTFDTWGISAGASTSLFGIIAAVGTLGLITTNPAIIDMAKGFTALIVINLIYNIFDPTVSMTGHIGGAIGGGLLGLIIPVAYTYRIKNQKLVSFLAFGVFILLMVLFTLYPLQSYR